MLKCVECGHIFEWGEEARWSESRGECHGFPASEEMVGCPICKGDFEKTKSCNYCSEDFLDEELFNGYCEECIKMHITYEKALEFLIGEDELCDFIFVSLWKVPQPILLSNQLREAMKEIYLRSVADDRIRKTDSFLNLIKTYILEKRSRKSLFTEYI